MYLMWLEYSVCFIFNSFVVKHFKVSFALGVFVELSLYNTLKGIDVLQNYLDSI